MFRLRTNKNNPDKKLIKNSVQRANIRLCRIFPTPLSVTLKKRKILKYEHLVFQKQRLEVSVRLCCNKEHSIWQRRDIQHVKFICAGININSGETKITQLYWRQMLKILTLKLNKVWHLATNKIVQQVEYFCGYIARTGDWFQSVMCSSMHAQVTVSLILMNTTRRSKKKKKRKSFDCLMKCKW